MALSDELEALAKRHGALSYRNRADTQNPAFGFTEDGLNGLIGEVLAKWGTPQPVVQEPLTQGQIESLLWTHGYDPDDDRMVAILQAAHGIKGGQHGAE